MYVKISNGAVDQYPYTVGNLRRDNPNTSFPKTPSAEMLAEWGVYPVTVEAAPSFNVSTQKIAPQTTPNLVDGSWVLTYSVIDKTQDELDAYEIKRAENNRVDRNEKLSETDFYALSDVTMSAEMTAYRQALRDITSHANWPHLEEADWPTKP